MTSKEAAIELIWRFPEDAALDDITEELDVRRSIVGRLAELDECGGLTQKKVKQRLAKWLA